MRVFILLLSLLSFTAYADFKLLETREVYLDYYHFERAFDAWLLPTGQPKEQLDLHVNLDLFNSYVFLNNTIHSQMDALQYRKISWQYRLGLQPCSMFQVWIEHKSEHLMDIAPAAARSYDAIGFTLYLYRKE